jgi:hypothetical protein
MTAVSAGRRDIATVGGAGEARERVRPARAGVCGLCVAGPRAAARARPGQYSAASSFMPTCTLIYHLSPQPTHVPPAPATPVPSETLVLNRHPIPIAPPSPKRCDIVTPAGCAPCGTPPPRRPAGARSSRRCPRAAESRTGPPQRPPRTRPAPLFALRPVFVRSPAPRARRPRAPRPPRRAPRAPRAASAARARPAAPLARPRPPPPAAPPPPPPPVKGTRRVQLVRRDGRDVSTLYGREGEGGGGRLRLRLGVRLRLRHAAPPGGAAWLLPRPSAAAVALGAIDVATQRIGAIDIAQRRPELDRVDRRRPRRRRPLEPFWHRAPADALRRRRAARPPPRPLPLPPALPRRQNGSKGRRLLCPARAHTGRQARGAGRRPDTSRIREQLRQRFQGRNRGKLAPRAGRGSAWRGRPGARGA